MTPTASEKPQTGKLTELEGLRAYLAWWVVFGHFAVESGWQASFVPTPLKLLLNPGLAVTIFIILSGFVITLLLDREKVSYRHFIATRAFRIFPLFYVLLVIGALTLPWLLNYYPAYLSHIGGPIGLEELWGTWAHHTERMPEYLAVSFLGLHGCIPVSWLPHAQSAFVSQAWSISLEWQFYLVAPLLWWGTKRRWGLVGLGALIFTLMGVRHLFAVGDWSSFLPQSLEYFVVGAVSYLAFRDVRLVSGAPATYARALFLVILVAVALVQCFSALIFTPWTYLPVVDRSFALGIWLGVLALAIARRHAAEHPFVRLVSAPLTNRVALFLGRISYSTYLTHYLVIYLLQWLALQLFPHAINKWSMTGFLLAAGVPIIVLLSISCYYLIERPGIAIGKRLTAKLHKTLSIDPIPVAKA